MSNVQGVTKAEYLMLSQQGEVLWQQGRAAEAEKLFRDLLAMLETGAAYDAAYDHALALWRLGRCLAAQWRPAQAIEWHRKALGEIERLSELDEDAKKTLGKVYTDLGDNLAAVGQFDLARRAYESGLEISKSAGDYRAVGVRLGQLGTLALSCGDLGEAARRYTEALETFRALGEPQSEAVVWHQLGRAAQGAKNWDEAERCYREAVRIREQIRGLLMLATDYNQLAIVAQGAGRLDDAEQWYLRALDGFVQTGQMHYAAVASNNLANLYLSQCRLDEAARYARQAVEIVEHHQIRTEVWKMYHILAEIAQAQGCADEAAQWRRKEQESFAACAGAAYETQRYQPLIQRVVAACQGNEQARKWVEGEFPRMEVGSQDWAMTAAAIRRVLAGKRNERKLCANLDRVGAHIVRAILRQLAGEDTPSPPAPSPAEQERGSRRGQAPLPSQGRGREWGLSPASSSNGRPSFKT